MEALLALLALGLAVAALLKSGSNKQQLDYVERRLRGALADIEKLTAERRERQAPEPEPQHPVIAEMVHPSEAPAPVLETAAPPPEPPPYVEPDVAPVAAKSLEEMLTANWLVWIGALAIALAGTFLVRYAIENGLLGPGARVTLGLALGIALVVAGEWLRRRPLERAIAAVRVNNVPPALTASGLFIAFASIYAAYALYDLLAPVVAFVGLALVALAGVGLSLLQGRFVALMGLLGAFAAPALVTTNDPQAWTLFAYLLVVELACLAVARTQRWWWLALATLAGVVVWPLLWMAGSPLKVEDGLPIGLFLLVSMCAFFAMRRGLPEPEGRADWVAEVQSFDLPEWVVWVAGCAIALVQFTVVNWAGFGTASLVLTDLLIVLYIAMGRRFAVFDSLAIVASLLALMIAAAMPGPADAITALRHDPPVTPEYFQITVAVFGAIFGASGFAVLWGAKRPALWAAVSAATPVLLLLLTYYRFTSFAVDASWSAVALGLAALAGVAVERIERYRVARGLENALAFYAAAVVALVSLAMAMLMREAWLTVALAVQLPALAWIGTRIRVRSIEVIAAVVAFVVLVRLVLNWNVLGYALGPTPPLGWVLYGYGVPAVAFYAAARLFRQAEARAEPIAMLEAGSLAFAVLLVSLEIRLFVEGSLAVPHYGLFEQSLHSIAWASIATAVASYTRRAPNTTLFTGAAVLFGAAAAQVVLLQLLAANPLVTHESVGSMPVANVLFLAYAVPALFAFRFAAAIAGTKFDGFSHFAGGLGFVLVFAYLSFETTRAFEGPVFEPSRYGDGELYAYSIVWLAYAVALLALGIVLKRSILRYASLAVLVITVGKVFLIDMSGLTGLYRVGSFLGLGLSLIAIGWIYQRFVFPRPQPRGGGEAGRHSEP
ncbi:MAG TPA: DUF2339 domain-containing protein [Rhizomicrobium sp.]|nr:DUF2339 domain-containing protein [Rhizomicrobium sp.]